MDDLDEMPDEATVPPSVMARTSTSIWTVLSIETKELWKDLFRNWDADEWDDTTMEMFAAFLKCGIEERLDKEVSEDEDEGQSLASRKRAKKGPPPPAAAAAAAKPRAPAKQKQKGVSNKRTKTSVDAFQVGDCVSASLENGASLTGKIEKIYNHDAHVKAPGAGRPTVVKLDDLEHAVREKTQKNGPEKPLLRGSFVIAEVRSKGKLEKRRIEGVVQKAAAGFLQISIKGRTDWQVIRSSAVIHSDDPPSGAGASEERTVVSADDLFGDEK